MLAVVFVPRRSRVVWTPGMPPKRKDSRRNRDAPALLPQITLRGGPCQIRQKPEGRKRKAKGKGQRSKGKGQKSKVKTAGLPSVSLLPPSYFFPLLKLGIWNLRSASARLPRERWILPRESGHAPILSRALRKGNGPAAFIIQPS